MPAPIGYYLSPGDREHNKIMVNRCLINLVEIISRDQ